MAGRDRWDREDDDRGMFGSSPYRGFSGDFSGRGWSGDTFSDRDYKPLTGDYGRGEFERPRGRLGRDDERRGFFGGVRERSHDPHYAEWRNRQIEQLDRDYDEYRRENQARFDKEFGAWRERRGEQRRAIGRVTEQMEVIGSDGAHVGTVDCTRTK
jgi:hypothetical protein